MSTPSLIWDGAMRKVLEQNRIFPRPLTGTKKLPAREISGPCAAWEAFISPARGFYLSGKPVPYDPAKAFQLFEKAANANIPAAQYNLSVLYRYGEGVEKDEENADFWRMKAAQNGFKIAIKELENPDKDPEELA